ncbi:2-nonaprenyl-3-methyl-6-methoxy-1,4-benzoquinol hydroxylase [Aliidongia dinghuensis]|uniref:3-demethoxyubiquinol 3-hydroxylase n=1 Tax=Aliidongia dinghuensis TaxID=1867774 RepID=A0A8J2YXV0_9PROT|nr:demethoxyubiquinone hydroxylase family protein [Aliidongia dinghuensis]GGF38252.1 2-nonaprenyl-3-methyl-6-methoxy-1,4-benzoquinol hydroxylase [Aliidongia dinghuensis]
MSAKPTLKRYLPGDPPPAEQVKRMVRVDHAGEHGAARIYEGQLAILGRRPVGDTIRHMAEQEREHRAVFDRMLVERRVRPTLLGPFWDVAGYALGAATALMGERAAMACTVAVEEVIDEHYQHQADALGDAEPELKAVIEKFQADEREHRDTGLAHGAEATPGYEALSAVIKAGSRLAIWMATRI